jgi:hypothetical protein
LAEGGARWITIPDITVEEYARGDDITIAVVFIVPSMVSRSIASDRRPFHHASPSDASTPSEAASVGVAMPT